MNPLDPLPHPLGGPRCRCTTRVEGGAEGTPEGRADARRVWPHFFGEMGSNLFKSMPIAGAQIRGRYPFTHLFHRVFHTEHLMQIENFYNMGLIITSMV